MVSTKAEGTRINVVKYIFLGFVLGYAFSFVSPEWYAFVKHLLIILSLLFLSSPLFVQKTSVLFWGETLI